MSAAAKKTFLKQVSVMLDCVRVEYCGQSANLILQKLDILGRDSKWKMMAHTYGQHYHIFMVLYLVVHMSELQRITKNSHRHSSFLTLFVGNLETVVKLKRSMLML